MKAIPIHHLQAEFILKLNIARFEMGSLHEESITDVHRDDHYIFFMFEKGSATLTIDFQKVSFCEKSVFYVLPGQVHQRIDNKYAEGWYLAIDTVLVPPEYRNIFERYLGLQQPLYLDAPLVNQCSKILRLIMDRSVGDVRSAFQSNITLSLFQSFAGIVADGYNYMGDSIALSSRPKQLAYDFRKLLTHDFRSLKTPTGYAKSLNVSVNYLNEAIKKMTGFSVSFWITRQILLEAKRLLIYTIMDVKEVAYEIGYADPSYFSKWFKKHEGMSPLSFRAKSLE